MDKKTILIIILIAIITFGAGLYVGSEVLEHETDCKTSDKKNNSNKVEDDDEDDDKKQSSSKDDDKKKDDDDEDEDDDAATGKKTVVWGNDDYKVVVQGDRLYLNDKLLTKNIKKYITVALDESLCEGNSYLVALLNDGSIASLSIGRLACEDTVVFTEDIANYLGEATDIYAKLNSKLLSSQPDTYSVYAVFNGEAEVITNRVENSY